MIGDWVKKGNLLGKVVDIEQMENNAIVGVEFIEGGYDVYNDDELDPIPLTTEIMKNNGYSGDGLDVALFDRNGGDDFVGGAKLEYIHELQHVLRLCGIEKEIVL